MKKIYFFFLFFLCHYLHAQTVSVSGQCISNTILLSKISNINGRAAYQGTGTVAGLPGTTVTIYWVPSPDLIWVLDFEGQPYFQNPCNTSLPPATSVTSCTWSDVSGTSCTGGTALSINGSGTLPVDLIGFAAAKTNQGVLLTWKTASETNNKGFEVQRSMDGSSWIKTGFVNGAVNSSTEKSYSFSDSSPFSGTNYYRLNQVDLDNRQKLSPVVSMQFASSAEYVLNTSNTSSGIYQFTVRSAEPLEVSVLDMGGTKLIQAKAGQGVHLLDISRYAPGIYLLQLGKNNKIVTEKLVKK